MLAARSPSWRTKSSIPASVTRSYRPSTASAQPWSAAARSACNFTASSCSRRSTSRSLEVERDLHSADLAKVTALVTS